jgi:hypothetical protein
VRGGLLAVAAAAASYLLLARGPVPGIVGPGTLVALLVLVPTARGGARRVAFNGAFVIGWLPALWWVAWPVDLDHGAAAVSVAVGGLVLRVAGSRTPSRRAAELLPRLRSADLALPLAGVAALVAMWPWASAATPRQALLTLLPGVDNASHFQVFATMRAEGAELGALGQAPQGATWSLDFYPAAFHSLVATLSELLTPHLTPGPGALVAYTHGVAAVVVLGTLVLVAAVVSLPRLGSRPALVAPAVTLTCMAFLWEPGQKVLADGFAPFWLGTVAATIALLLSVGPAFRHAGLWIATVGGLVVTVAHTWTLLLVVVAPAAIVLLVEVGSARSLRRRRLPRWAVALALLALAGAVLKGALVLTTMLDLATLVSANGGITGTSPVPTLFLLLTLGYLGLRLPGWVRRHPGSTADDLAVARRVSLLSLVGAFAVVALTALLVAQLRTLGTTSYYFLKSVVGVELVLAGLVPAAVAVAVALLLGPSRRPRLAAAASCFCVLLATQAFAPFPFGRVGLAAHPGGTAALGSPSSARAQADGILEAVSGSGRRASFSRTYLALGPQRSALAFYPDSWFHAVLASSTSRSALRNYLLRERLDGPEDAAPVVRRLLETSSDARVVVAPRYLVPLRRFVGDPALGRRIVSWDPAAG